MNSSAGKYIFTSERLGFRTWDEVDTEPMTEINADPRVMEFFPSVQSRDQTKSFIQRMRMQYEEKGYCYYAVETLHDESFIGFAGLSEQVYEAPFTPCIDIGWRFKTSAWNKGYATEAAERILRYAFTDLQFNEVIAVAPLVNARSVRVMQKAGMKPLIEFDHPALLKDERLRRCTAYVAQHSTYRAVPPAL